MTNEDILLVATAGHNKIESEIFKLKHKSPTRTMNEALERFGFKSLYHFTCYLKDRYDNNIDPDDIFMHQMSKWNYPMWLIKPDKREIILSYYKSIIRDIKINSVMS